MLVAYEYGVVTVDRLPKSIADKVVNDGGCWVWTASFRADGYGQMWWRDDDGKRRLWGAHRLTYTLLRGPIPPGLVLDHVVCERPACVNPWHVEATTQRANILRSATAHTAVNARKTHCSRGHALAGDNMKVARSGQRYCKACRRLNHRDRKNRLEAA